MNKKTLLSGVKPTGRPHIGNYFGAMKQFVDMQDDYNAIYMIADYHALNLIHNKEDLSGQIMDVAIDYLALGLDPQKSIIFKQSDVAEHAELAWIFDTLTPMPYLMLAHAFKDKLDELYFENNDVNKIFSEDLKKSEDKPDTFRSMINLVFKGVNVGTFNYPMLMAADILIYDADIVPVGQDQKQHVEYARDTAQKFNFTFNKEVFKLPDAKILDNVAVVPGTDGRKMSKSYGNTIPLFATLEEIKKAVMSIPTDSKGVDEPKNPEEDNVFKLHKLFAKEDELHEIRERYEKGGLGYKESKDLLIKNVDAFIAPLREKRAQIAHDTDYVLDVLREGGKRAKQKAEKKMDQVREAIGVKLY